MDLTNDHPLVLGNLHRQTLEEILDGAEENVILHAIRLWGPKKIIGLLEAAGLGHCLPDHYIKHSVCHACYELMAQPAIVDYLKQLSDDSEFKEMVAYGRVYYLNEVEMVTRLGLYHPLEQSVAA